MCRHGRHQSGVVLAISLIVLMLLAIIGVSATHSTVVEEKMLGNARARNLAFQAAESTLLAGEQSLHTTTAAFNCQHGLYKQQDIDCDGIKENQAIWESPGVWGDDAKSIKYAVSGDAKSLDLGYLKASPRYIIEELGLVCPPGEICTSSSALKKYYRVTARATGSTPDSVVMLQSTYQP